MLYSYHAFSLFSQPPPKQPTSPSSPRTRWLFLVSQWLYPVSLWDIGEWYNGPKTAWHWVERETYQVLLLSFFLFLSASLFSLLLSVCLLLSLSMPGLIRNLSLSNVGVLHKSMFREQCTADRSGCCLYSPNFNLLLSILRVLWEGR